MKAAPARIHIMFALCEPWTLTSRSQEAKRRTWLGLGLGLE